MENTNILGVNSIVQINTDSYNKDEKVILQSNVKKSMKKSMKKSEIINSHVLHSKKSEDLVINVEEPLPQTFGNANFIESPKKSHDESVIINNMMIEKASEIVYDPSILDMES